MNQSHVDLLQGLLERYSPTGREQSAVTYFVSALESMGYAATVDGCGNAVGVLGHGERELLLLGHIDTVPGVVPVRHEDSRLFGRGAVDAKGPLACFASAAAQAGAHPGWRVRVIGAVGEEGDSRGARYLTRRLPSPEMVIIGEPSGWEQVCLGYKGTLWFTYSITRSVTHSAGAGESACEAAYRFWANLLVWAEQENLEAPRRFEQVSPTLRGMHSDSDGLTDSARLTINIRLPQRLEPRLALQQLHMLAQGGVIWPIDHLPAYRSEKNIPPARALLAAIRKQGGQPTFSVKSGSSDMNIVGPAWGSPIVAYGPGDSALDHTPHEHIEIPEYLRSIDVLADALQAMMA